jgi:hypothetical protein
MKLFRNLLLLFLLSGILSFATVHAQEQKPKLNLKDTFDNKLDLGEYIVNLHGLVPFPMIITEPALGNFGGALGLVLISPKKAEGDKKGFLFPDITAVIGLYTANKTWGAGAFRQGSLPKLGMRYRIGGLYADVNMNFYREIPGLGEQEFLINMLPLAFILDGSRNIWKNKIFAGVHYNFFNTKVESISGGSSEFVFDSDQFDKNMSTLGLYAQWDNRNSIFTPDKGLMLKASSDFSRDWLGSDFNTQRYTAFANLFLQPRHNWVSGLKVEWQGVADDAPFYYLPFISMRGIPVMRYQGQQTLLFETEQRIDLGTRWSLIGFAGTGRTYSDKEFSTDDSWHWAGGGGFRYLMARAFKLRMGVDLAVGPDQVAYYMVFGHYWNK